MIELLFPFGHSNNVIIIDRNNSNNVENVQIKVRCNNNSKQK